MLLDLKNCLSALFNAYKGRGEGVMGAVFFLGEK
jgi:hypothetical protein